jgi:hypothetical protein
MTTAEFPEVATPLLAIVSHERFQPTPQGEFQPVVVTWMQELTVVAAGT